MFCVEREFEDKITLLCLLNDYSLYSPSLFTTLTNKIYFTSLCSKTLLPETSLWTPFVYFSSPSLSSRVRSIFPSVHVIRTLPSNEGNKLLVVTTVPVSTSLSSFPFFRPSPSVSSNLHHPQPHTQHHLWCLPERRAPFLKPKRRFTLPLDHPKSVFLLYIIFLLDGRYNSSLMVPRPFSSGKSSDGVNWSVLYQPKTYIKFPFRFSQTTS